MEEGNMVSGWKNSPKRGPAFSGKKVAVLGLGIEGLSSALYLRGKGAIVTVLDQKEKKDLDKKAIELLSNLPALPCRQAGGRQDRAIQIVSGKDYLKNLNKFDIIVRSPGAKRILAELIKAEKKGAVITSQTKIFFDLCPCPIIGVTGTKGKGTTAMLIYEMLKIQGINVYLGGNIGKPPLEFLDKLTPRSIVVLELSSFQLQDITKSPHIAVMLMTTSEHLDYHKDTNEYIDAKRNILRFQTASDIAILNRDYPASRESDIYTRAKIYRVSREKECEEGCFVRNGKVILRTFGKLGEPKIETIQIKDILLPGAHNLENVCAAVLVATLFGVTLANMVSVLKTFRGLEHRLELVGEVNGVGYYDDSFSTTPETAIAAIEAFDRPEILILGGSSKGSDFSELGRVISCAPNIKAIIGIGVEWPRIKKMIKDKRLMIKEGCKNMREIVQAASDAAKPGDVVLLSPACASFDMFRNYKDRGDQFKKEVHFWKVRIEKLDKRLIV